MRLRRLPAWAGSSPESVPVTPRARAFPASGVALAAGYLALALASRAIVSVDGIPPIWLPAGLAFAALYRRGTHLWPAIVAGSLADGLLAGDPLPVALGVALSNVAEPLVGVALARRFHLGRMPSTVRNVTLFAGSVAVPASVTGAAGFLLAHWVAGHHPQPGWILAFFLWGQAHALGLVVGTPIFVRLGPALAAIRRRPKEALGLLALFVATLLLVFTPFLGAGFEGRPILFPIAPLLLWGAIRFGLGVSSSLVLLIILIGAPGTMDGYGPFADYEEPFARFLAGELFVGIQALLVLVVAASDAERLEAIRVRDQFLTLASHELKTPLTPLKTGLQLARRTVEAGGVPSPELLDRIERQLLRLDRLVETLLEVMRRRPKPLDLAEFDLGRVAREVCSSLEGAAQRAGARVDCETEAVVGRWDRHQLERMLESLLTNAFLHAPESVVEVRVERVGVAARLTVRDHGPGVPAADRERIFRPYERGAGTASGLGLGLHLARRIAEAHGGSIALAGTPGNGATFEVVLPLVPGEGEAPPAPEEEGETGLAAPAVGPTPSIDRWRRRLALGGVAVAYFGLAQTSLGLASVGSFSFFWPASGVAVAGLVLLGPRAWPAVAVGAGTSALLAGSPPVAAVGETLANVLEGLVGAWLFRRLDLDPTLNRVRDVALFAGPVIWATALAGGAIGPLSFWLGGVVPAASFPKLLGLWILGDALGLLVVAPVILAVRGGHLAAFRERPLEAALILAGVATTVVLVYSPVLGPVTQGRPLSFLTLPLLLLAAVRLGMGGATVAMLLIGIGCAVGTVHGQGPFADYEGLIPRIVAAQAYLFVDALSAFVLAAVGSERFAAIRRRDQVLVAVSRELQAPLAPLRTAARRVRSRIAAGDLPRPGVFADLEVRVDRLSRLVEELLRVSRSPRATPGLPGPSPPPPARRDSR